MTGREVGPVDRTDEQATQRWVYESLVNSLPGVGLSTGIALAFQLLVFETGVLLLAIGYDRWESFPAGTAAVLVAAVGSGFLLTLGRRLRRLDGPNRYTNVLFGTGFEIVLGLVSFFALVTYLFVIDRRSSGPSLLVTLLGDPVPAPAVFFVLVILWDVCYRIGTGWWASLVGLWRSLRFSGTYDRETSGALARLDGVTIGFAWVQLSLVPFVWEQPLLGVAVVGHVVAVTLVSGASILVLRRARTNADEH